MPTDSEPKPRWTALVSLKAEVSATDEDDAEVKIRHVLSENIHGLELGGVTFEMEPNPVEVVYGYDEEV